MNKNDERAKIHAVLKHLGCGEDLCNFPVSAPEKVALVKTATTRRLIAWHKGHNRYELTAAGWRVVAPSRRFGLGSLMVGTTVGATIGAALLGFFWLSADASHRLPSGRSTAAVSERANFASVHTPAPPPPAASASAVPAPEPIDQPRVAEQPAPEEPIAADPPPKVKVVTKKPRHRTASRRRREDPRATWAAIDPWRSRQQDSNQGSWLSYR